MVKLIQTLCIVFIQVFLQLNLDYFESDKSDNRAICERKDQTLTYSPFDDKVYLIGGWACDKWYNNQYTFSDVWSISSGKNFL